MNTRVVVDTSVIVDIFLADRPRHPEARRLGDYLCRSGTVLRVPMHAVLELKWAVSAEIGDRIAKKQPIAFNRDIGEQNPLRLDPVPIDQAFITTYFDPAIPQIRAGDYPFVAIAKRERLPLITEDDGQYDAAKRAGVIVLKIAEYLAAVGA
jgi:predicted nucleic acid-binding protein